MRGKELTNGVIKIVESHWPTHIKEIVRDLGFEETNHNIKKIAYHVNKLKREEKVRTKRIGKALIVWPVEIERIRVIYEMLR